MKSMRNKDSIPGEYLVTTWRWLAMIKTTSDNKLQRDRKLKPVNSDCDLYSAGKDQLTKPAVITEVSREDFVRCKNGRYIEPVVSY